MKANLATSLIACARGGVRKQLLVLCLLTLCVGNMWASAYLKGAWDSWVNHDISGGSCEITLDANTEYEFGIDVDGSFYSYSNQNFTTTSTRFQIYTGNGNCKITTGEAGTYIFKTWYDNGRYMAVYYPQARLTKQKYIYFDARNQTNWNSADFDARFWFKYYDSGVDNGSVDCNKGNALENWVYYALVPDHDYIGQIQMNRLNPSNHDDIWCTANIAYAKDRTSSAQNCLKEESGKANYCNYWTPQWTTYCPPMSSVTLADNGTTNWGGNGSSGNPFLVPTGGDIKVHVTASASALDDANMTKYFLFKKEGSAVGEGSSSTEKTITASGTTNTKEAVTVDAYNYYNSTEGTHLTSSAIYYEARTPYTISYNAGTGGSGSRASETKLKGVNFTLPNSAVFERTGYTQTGWTTSNLGAQTHAFGASYSSDEAQTFYPVWSENEYNITINVAGSGTTSPASSTIGKIETPSGDITATPGTGYSFSQWGFSKQGESDYDVWCADGYTPTNATIRILAKRDGTLTAKFTANNYNVNLENLDADEKGTENVSVTYNSSANLTENITIPQKEHYDFGGYYTSSDEGVTLDVRLIDENGAWIASVDGYTDGDKNWLYTDNLTLYAKWTEHPYTIALVVAPEGAGTIDKGATIEAYYVTASDDITANASTGYSFIEWDFSKTGEDNDVYSADDYTSLSNPIRVLAQHDGTLTAKFTANNYNVNLENLDADEKGTENVSVTYNSSANLTENITIPQKAHYDFGGYYTSSDEGVTLDVRLIDENGAWIASVDGYTDGDKNWLYADNLTLYAKWTEHPYTIDLVVSPEGAGTIKIGEDVVGSVNAFISTQTDLITATPANPAWKFKGWQYSENVGPADGTGNDNTVQINATRNGTLTAVFESRYCLVGQLNDGSNEAGGMPGMDDYTVDFDFVSYTGLGEEGVELRCTRSLQPNKQYKFAIHDHVIGRNYGKNSDLDNPTLDAGESWELNTIDHDVLFNTSAAGEYTFKITHMTYGENGDYKCYYPTVEIVYPTAHQLELGWRYTLIDNPDELKEGDTGGTVTAASSGFSIKDKEYIADGEELQLTANANTGYRFDDKWYDNNDCQHSFMSGNPTHATVTSHFRVYAKFAEIPTPITITKIGGGEVQINGEDKESTSVGVTTTRTLTAVAAAGYTFIGWTLPDNADFEMIEGDVDNPTITLRGKGAGTAGEIIANFTECWVLSAESDGWGSAEFTIANITVEDGKAIGYADIALPANTNLQFKVVDKSTSSAYKNGVDQVYYMTYGNSQDWGFGTDKTYNCGITTAGRGSYRFNWNFTDKTMTVEYPESYQVNYGAAVGGSVTSVLDDDGKEIPNGGYVRKGGSVTYEATASDGYTFTGWCPDDSYGDTFTDINPWENSNITATSNAYAKFHSTNFVIYRTGDKASDPRAVWDDVESYEGGTISETIEFRMKVNELDYWYTLCLPFEVNAVKVWDEVDGKYYDIVPYWRTNGTYYTGHYILRRPVTTTDFAIEGFEGRDRWIDPESRGVLPSKNIPYIIQWHDAYFQDMYISFFGDAGQTIQTIQTAMDEVSYASSDETVNIYGNNSMTTVTVRDAYLLDPDYGPDGAWIREDIGTERSVLPFECFILANSTTTAKYRVLRRDMADDTPTGLDTLSMTEDSVSKVMINNRIYIIRGGKIYTIQGTFVKEVE